jgi:hypothetical protein
MADLRIYPDMACAEAGTLSTKDMKLLCYRKNKVYEKREYVMEMLDHDNTDN